MYNIQAIGSVLVDRRGMERNGMKKRSPEEFLEEAHHVHGEKYVYLDAYVNKRTNIRIHCPHHGMFVQNPHAHLQGKGCWLCGVKKRASTQCRSHQSFVQEAAKIHNRKYVYNDLYRGRSSKVQITCPLHGDFYQLADNHLSGHGCPRCKDFITISDKISATPNIPCTLYLLLGDSNQFVKVGITTHSVAFRYRERKYNQVTLKPLYTKVLPLHQAVAIEEKVKQQFRDDSVRPLSMPDGHTECFKYARLLDICEFVDDLVENKWGLSTLI